MPSAAITTSISSPKPSSSSSPSPGLIIALALSLSVLALLVLGCVIWLLSRGGRRRRAAERYAEGAVHPFVPHPTLLGGSSVPRLRMPVPPVRRSTTGIGAGAAGSSQQPHTDEKPDADMFGETHYYGRTGLPAPPPAVHIHSQLYSQLIGQGRLDDAAHFPPYPNPFDPAWSRSQYLCDVKR